jgi:hypothetical protein
MVERRKDYPELIRFMNKNGDDIISLKEYFDVKISNLDKSIEVTRIALEKSTELLRLGIEKRMDAMNEFRKSLEDQTNKYLTIDSYEGRHVGLQKQVDELRILAAESRGKASQSSVLIAWGVAGIGIIISVIALIKDFMK